MTEEPMVVAGEELKVGDLVYVSKGKALKVCAECDNRRWVPEDQEDGEGHTMSGVNMKRCICNFEGVQKEVFEGEEDLTENN